MPLKFKPATIKDLDYIVEVYNSIIPGRQVTADLTQIKASDWLPWFHQHDNKKRPIWMLFHEGHTCGWMSFTDYKSRAAYDVTAEVSIYLEEKTRGQGLGKAFLSKGIERIKERGLKNVLAVIYAANIPSVKLFEKLGFETWGLLPKICEVEGIEKDVVILGKRL